MTDRVLRSAFPAVEAVLWAGFLALDLGTFPAAPPGLSTALKYAGILLCVLCAWCAALRYHGTDRLLLAAALSFTALADWFLLVLDRRYLLGVLCFCPVQILYFVRLRRLRRRHGLRSALLRVGLIALVLALLRPEDALTAVTVFYFLNLVCNCAEAFLTRREGCARRGFAPGLLLFVFCDICVGLRNLGLGLPAAAAAFVQVGMWLFYLPSQVLIVCSGLPEKIGSGTQ